MEFNLYVAHAHVNPYIPDFIIVKIKYPVGSSIENETIRLLRKSDVPTTISELKFNEMSRLNEIEFMGQISGFKDGQWLIVNDSEVEWYDKDDETNFIVMKAMDLLKEAKGIMPSKPIESVRILQAIATMCGTNVGDIIKVLETKRTSQKESYSNIFKRILKRTR